MVAAANEDFDMEEDYDQDQNQDEMHNPLLKPQVKRRDVSSCRFGENLW